MGRTKDAWRLISVAAAAREFGVSWDRMAYLVRRFHLTAVPVTNGDKRSKWLYRYVEIKQRMVTSRAA